MTCHSSKEAAARLEAVQQQTAAVEREVAELERQRDALKGTVRLLKRLTARTKLLKQFILKKRFIVKISAKKLFNFAFLKSAFVFSRGRFYYVLFKNYSRNRICVRKRQRIQY